MSHKDSRRCDKEAWLLWALNNFEMRKMQNEISTLSGINNRSQALTAGDLTWQCVHEQVKHVYVSYADLHMGPLLTLFWVTQTYICDLYWPYSELCRLTRVTSTDPMSYADLHMRSVLILLRDLKYCISLIMNMHDVIFDIFYRKSASNVGCLAPPPPLTPHILLTKYIRKPALSSE